MARMRQLQGVNLEPVLEEAASASIGIGIAMARMRQLQGVNLEPVLEEAAAIVRQGGVLAMPTESFYALGASPFHEEAVRRLCRIKGRDERKPLLVLIADLAQLDSLVSDVARGASVLMRQFWPGPLTIIFPAAPSLPVSLTAGTGTVGVPPATGRSALAGLDPAGGTLNRDQRQPVR